MTQFIGTSTAGGLLSIRTQDDKQLWSQAYRGGEGTNDVVDKNAAERTYQSPWWGRGSSGFIGDRAVDVGLFPGPLWWEYPELNSGVRSGVAFVGVARDQFGTPMGGATVKLFKTADGSYPGTKDKLIFEGISDSNGAFAVLSQFYPDTHYIVAYKAGTPDVEGTTVNTLIGA